MTKTAIVAPSKSDNENLVGYLSDLLMNNERFMSMASKYALAALGKNQEDLPLEDEEDPMYNMYYNLLNEYMITIMNRTAGSWNNGI